jgi:ATP-dependent DNA helicase RecQ
LASLRPHPRARLFRRDAQAIATTASRRISDLAGSGPGHCWSQAARSRGAPAYVVLHDSTIDGNTASRPTMLMQFREISSIGDK